MVVVLFTSDSEAGTWSPWSSCSVYGVQQRRQQCTSCTPGFRLQERFCDPEQSCTYYTRSLKLRVVIPMKVVMEIMKVLRAENNNSVSASCLPFRSCYVAQSEPPQTTLEFSDRGRVHGGNRAPSRGERAPYGSQRPDM